MASKKFQVKLAQEMKRMLYNKLLQNYKLKNLVKLRKQKTS